MKSSSDPQQRRAHKRWLQAAPFASGGLLSAALLASLKAHAHSRPTSAVPKLKATPPGSAWATSTSTIAPQGTRQRGPRLAASDVIFACSLFIQISFAL
jgi:hypothetical protein